MDQLIEITGIELPGMAVQLQENNCRLVQIMCSMVGQDYELTYNFDNGGALFNLRVQVPAGGSISSITTSYIYAFIWENEIHDLFGLEFENMVPEFNYHGKFFRLAEATPWNPGAQVVVPKGLGIDASVKTEGGGENV